MKTPPFAWFVFPFVAACLVAEEPIPRVRTVDLGAMLASAQRPLTIAGAVKPGTSVASETVEWRGDEGKEMARVAALSPIELQTNGDPLKSVLRAICDRAVMKHIIVGDDPVFDSPITLNGTQKPWEYLQTLSSLYNIEIKFQHGMWQIYALNTAELVERTYLLRHNTLERFSAAGSGGSGAGAQKDRQAERGNSSGGNSRASIDRSGEAVFSVDSAALEGAIAKFLGLDAGTGITLAAADGALGRGGPRRTRVQTGPDAAAAKDGAKQLGGFVQFTAENNTLFVVATRAQHELLAAYIAQMDQPQKQILIESKFLLTSRNPKSHIGAQNPLFADSGVSAKLSGLQNKAVDPSRIDTWKIPTAVFSVSDLEARLSLMNSTSDTSTAQYPTQVTLSGREVTIRSVRQIPIVSSSMRDTTASVSNTSSQIEFVDVGTVIAVLPKVLDDKNVMMNISITVSSIASTTIIDGNPYPVVTSQTYKNQVIVESGYSLALGGLEQTLLQNDSKKIPIIGDIPFFGFLAKDVTRDTTHSVLTMIVTPRIMDGYNGGNASGLAQHTLPARGTEARTEFPGGSECSIDDVQASLRGFARDVEELEQILRESRADRTHLVRAKLLVNELDLMTITLKRERANGRSAPSVETAIKTHRNRLTRLIRQIPNTEPLT